MSKTVKHLLGLLVALLLIVGMLFGLKACGNKINLPNFGEMRQVINKDVENVNNLIANLQEVANIKLDDLITKGEIKEGIQRYYIDTVEINKRVLINLGVKKDNIICSDKCSLCNSDFIHSYRKDKDKSGRNLLLISMKTTK